MVNEGATLVCSGKIIVPDSYEKFLEFQDDLNDQEVVNWKLEGEQLVLNNKEVYKELRVRGYDYGSSFQGLMKANDDGSKGLML